MSFVSENFPDISFIDDTEVDDVLEEMISDYQERYEELTGSKASLGLADPYRLILYAAGLQIYQAMQYADYAGKMSFLKYSQGDYLDNLGALRGISRIQSTAATTVLEFSMDSAIQSVVAIPAGTRASNGNDVYFATDEYAEIAAGDTSVSVAATCTTSGTAGNGFAAGEFNVLVNTLAYVVSVTNTDETSGGADTETDDELRDRIYETPDSYSTAGPDGAYEYWTKQADSTIEDVVVYSDTPGVVEIVFTTEGGGIPDDTLIEKVEEYLMDEDIRPLTDTVIVSAPTTVEYDIECTYYIAASDKNSVASIQELVDSAVDAFNIWQTEKIGRDINPYMLIQKIVAAGAKRVDIDSPSFTVLSDIQLAQTGTVTVSYGGVEDD